VELLSLVLRGSPRAPAPLLRHRVDGELERRVDCCLFVGDARAHLQWCMMDVRAVSAFLQVLSRQRSSGAACVDHSTIPPRVV